MKLTRLAALEWEGAFYSQARDANNDPLLERTGVDFEEKRQQVWEMWGFEILDGYELRRRAV